MFLAQSFKKVLKKTFQEQKNANQEWDRFNCNFQDDLEPGVLNINDLISNPAYSGLLCNIYHDDRPSENIDEK